MTDKMRFLPYIEIVSMSMGECRQFIRKEMGMPDDRIDAIIDAGPSKSERYQAGAREYHLFLKKDTERRWCPYEDCGFCGSDDEVDDHRVHAHQNEPQAGSNLRNKP